MATTLKTPMEILTDISVNFKRKRLELRLTQEGLSKRSGVSYGSIKRFESTSKISLESLLNIALALRLLDAFDGLGKFETNVSNQSLDNILKQAPKKKQRGTIK